MALPFSDNPLTEVLNALDWGYWVRDLATGEMFWSEAFRRLHGIPAETPALRENFLAHVHPDDRQFFVARLERAYREGKGELRYRCCYPNGSVQPLIARIVVLPTPDGRRLAYGINRVDEWHLALQEQLQERTRTLQAVIDALPVGLMVFDANLALRYWNALAFQILEIPLTLAVEGTAFADLIRIPAQRGEYGPGDPETLVAERVALAQKFLPHRLERRRPDGRWHLVQGKPFHDAQGRPLGFVSTFTDITSLKEAEAALSVTIARLQTLIDNLPSAVTLFDADLRLVAWNAKLIELLGFPPELIHEGVTLEALIRYNIVRGEYGVISDPDAYVAQFLELARQFQPHQVERTRPNGQVLHIVGQPVPTGGFVTIYTDVTRERQTEAQLQRLALVDELTGLTNRTALLAQLPRLCQEARRRGERLAILLVDLDRFKWINDSAGHEVGDQILIQAAQRLSSVVRSSDLIARLAGDEFVIVAPVTQLLQVTELAERLLAAFSPPITLAAGQWQIGISIGVTLFPDDEQDPSALLRAADLAMHLAKGEGGNRYRYFTRQLQAQAQERVHLEQRLRLALHHETFSLVYQPIVDASGRLVSAEALLRWDDEELGVVSPARFIPFAEQMGLMPKIGQWVLAQGIRQMALWEQAGLKLPSLSINLSVHQLYDPELVETVQQLLASERVEPARLILEITESAMMQDPDVARQRILALVKLGIRFAVDDFGTGYSSLTYLHAFPLAELKIDRSFVAQLADEAADETIVDVIIQMAHRFDMSVVAEGVENETQRQQLLALGCDLFQGYHFARPLTPIALCDWVMSQQGQLAV